MAKPKATLALRVDFHISVIKVLLTIRSHGAELAVVRGQGALAACGLIRAESLEQCMRFLKNTEW